MNMIVAWAAHPQHVFLRRRTAVSIPLDVVSVKKSTHCPRLGRCYSAQLALGNLVFFNEVFVCRCPSLFRPLGQVLDEFSAPTPQGQM